MSDLQRNHEVSDDTDLVETPRYARVATHDGDQLGVCLFLTIADLQALNIEIKENSSTLLEYRVDQTTSQLILRSSSGD